MRLRHSALFVLLPGILAGAFLPAGAALADARQDVMFGAQRCAGIADDRTWLDCFYGAAQPMRAQLGLPPAPANQQRLVPQLAPAYAAPAYAPPVYTAPPAQAPSYAAPTYAAPRPAATTANGLPVPPPLPRRRSDGVFSSMFGSSRPVTVNQRMVSWDLEKGGKFVVTLANGEQWEQVLGDTNKVNWRGDASRHVVNVYEGALGTYNMNVSDDSTLYKVHRIN
jgi:hypothetical protein